MFHAAAAWILGYWVRKLEREPEEGEIEPVTRSYVEAGRRVSAADYLLAVEDLQAYARTVARSFAEVDLWLNPTLAEPPPPLGAINSSPDGQALLGRFVAFAGIVANITGGPAMSVPLHWTAEGLPIGVHFLGRYGDEATLLRLAAQLEATQPWATRRPG